MVSGFDWFIYLGTRSQILRAAAFPAVILGGLLPLIFPLFLLIVGKINKKDRTVNAAWGLAQAELVGWLVVAFYKSLTGRVHPDLTNSIVDISRNFRFGFWRGGIFWGWPSSHTTVAFAGAIALLILYRESKKVRYASVFYAFYVGLSVSITIHWFSEFAAGAIFGTLIGRVVGKSFLEHYKNKNG